MSPRPSATVRQRRLALILAELREADGRTATDVARQLGWSVSKLTRMEAGQMSKPQPSEITQLLDVYSVDAAGREAILTLVQQARQRGPWHDYRDAISGSYGTYVGLEAEARKLSNFEPTNIPGLLQTADYARALIAAQAPQLPRPVVEARVALRLDRQNRLTEPDPVELWAVVGEEALRRSAGGPEIMRAQLEHLRKMAELPNVHLQIHAMAQGVAPAAGPFVVIQFIEPTDPEAVYLETTAGDIWAEDPDEINSYLADFERLIWASLPVPDSIALIAAIERDL